MKDLTSTKTASSLKILNNLTTDTDAGIFKIKTNSVVSSNSLPPLRFGSVPPTQRKIEDNLENQVAALQAAEEIGKILSSNHAIQQGDLDSAKRILGQDELTIIPKAGVHNYTITQDILPSFEDIISTGDVKDEPPIKEEIIKEEKDELLAEVDDFIFLMAKKYGDLFDGFEEFERPKYNEDVKTGLDFLEKLFKRRGEIFNRANLRKLPTVIQKLKEQIDKIKLKTEPLLIKGDGLKTILQKKNHRNKKFLIKTNDFIMRKMKILLGEILIDNDNPEIKSNLKQLITIAHSQNLINDEMQNKLITKFILS